MTSAYELGFALAKAANVPMPNQGGLSMSILGNVPRLQMQTRAAPMAPQSMLPGSMPNAPLITGAAQPAIQAQAAGANQAATAGGGSPMQQLPQNRSTSLVPKVAADYQVPEQAGSFGSAVFTPESQGQRGDNEQLPKHKPKKARARSTTTYRY